MCVYLKLAVWKRKEKCFNPNPAMRDFEDKKRLKLFLQFSNEGSFQNLFHKFEFYMQVQCGL